LEKQRTRENRVPVQFGVVGVTVANVSPTVGVCVAVIVNTNASQSWASMGRRIDCVVSYDGFQCKSLRRDVVRILQREKETL
jgi:hypothetical protein